MENYKTNNPSDSDYLPRGENKTMTKKQIKPQTIINALIERFDDLENETGKDFTYAKRIIL